MLTERSSASRAPARLPWRLVTAVALGTLLNPLNSSTIAVALLSLQTGFHASIAATTWLISGFYLAAAIGMPLMGRLADLFGPRRIFCAGLLIVGTSCALAPFMPTLGWLIALRAIQAFGTSAAYPSGLALFRAKAQELAGSSETPARPPAGALGVLSVTGNVTAALGPTLGGFLVQAAGWPVIFLVNVPITALGLVAALHWLPPDASLRLRAASPRPHAAIRALLPTLDIPGILLFSGMLVSLLAFLLSLSGGPLWGLLPIAPLAALLLFFWERRASGPFINVRMLAANRRLVSVYAQFAAVNLVFYSLFFGLPLWLEQGRQFTPGKTGLIMLPFAGLGIFATFGAVQLIHRAGFRPALLLGALTLTGGTLLLLFFGPTTLVLIILAVIALLGIPNAFQNLGLQTALYDAAPAKEMGAAAGQFQTFRYVGSILSTSLLGFIFSGTHPSAGLHVIAILLAIISALLFIVALRAPHTTPSRIQ